MPAEYTITEKGKLESVFLPETEKDIVIPDTVKEIGRHVFYSKDIVSVSMPGVYDVGSYAFTHCRSLASVRFGSRTNYIGSEAFADCRSLNSVSLPESILLINDGAFQSCTSLASVDLPRIKKIHDRTFAACTALASVTIPDSVEEIGREAFARTGLRFVAIPDSVKEISYDSFDSTVTVICREGSFAHEYCRSLNRPFLFDYQFEAFHGVLPQEAEVLSAPFLADEEKPFIFISYSHRDRDTILPIIKGLYESGWKIWYDEGLTIGDSYDETLEAHVRDCSAFLLFATHNSLNSLYCRENEIPWAIRYGKPIVRCVLDETVDYEIREDAVAATVSPPGIEPALEKIGGLAKGDPRAAKGITVVFNPANRNETDTGEGESGFAYCLCAEKNAAAVKTILLSARQSGCVVHEADPSSTDDEEIKNCACLIVFMDHALLADPGLTAILTREYQAGRDLAVCQLEDLEEGELPQELVSLYKMQWLNFVHGINADMSTKLARHLQKRGCRDAAALPGFRYAIRTQGIAILEYTGLDPNPRLENEYGGIPVVEIAGKAFQNCALLKSFEIPSGVRKIGSWAFENCRALGRIVIPAGITEIGYSVFSGCRSLASVTICGNVARIGSDAFSGCASLPAIAIPGSVAEIGDGAFSGCASLSEAALPGDLADVGRAAFKGCAGLVSVTIPERITRIRDSLFEGCESLVSVTIRGKIREIGDKAFRGCSSLASIELENSLESVGRSAFEGCSALASAAIRGKVPRIERNTFKDCTGLEKVILPDSITEIGENAFENCKALASVNLPDSVTSIGKEAFKNCAGLPSVSLPSGLKAVSNSLFEGCEKLRSVNIPQSAAAIAYKAFYGCRNLVSVTIPNSEALVSHAVFQDCSGLVSAVLPDRMEEINEHLFAGCVNLKSVALPDTVKIIRQAAFENCRSLKSLTLPDGIEEIAPTAFSGCRRLTVFCSPDFPAWRQIGGVPVRYNKPGRADHPDSPYEGGKPYIFVNHSRRNEQTVFPIIRALQEKGLRVWYGQDGLSGAEAEDAEERLHHSSCSIQFISEEWARGWYYRKAAETAVNLGKPCLNIFLDESAKYGIDPMLTRENCIDQYDLPDEEFYRQLYAVPEIRKLLPSFGSRMLSKIPGHFRS